MILVNSIFDLNGDESISQQEYEREDSVLSQYRAYLFPQMEFNSIDVVKNGMLDIKDINKNAFVF